MVLPSPTPCSASSDIHPTPNPESVDRPFVAVTLSHTRVLMSAHGGGLPRSHPCVLVSSHGASGTHGAGCPPLRSPHLIAVIVLALPAPLLL